MGLEEWALALAGSPWVFVVMYAFATVDGFFPPLPSESLIIALAALSASSGEPNLVLLLTVAALGAFTGDQIAYQIGTKVHVRTLRLLRSKRAQASLDWAENALDRRGASFIIAARYIPIGRVAVNMSAGALGYPRRRFVGLTAVAAVMWAAYSAAIGIASGAFLEGHPVVAVGVGVVGGIVLGFLVDWALRRWHGRHDDAADEPTDEATDELAGLAAGPADDDGSTPSGSDDDARPVTGRSRSVPPA
ncbi:DedA family protein [Cellulomonas sp. PhB150]|uniref:DedA family protein n=1 Tax=Cellulomonas sp. PhB150 TaxID=2485188 RepID=UPI000FB5E105|nr:DedA family protein [Cellulomonas sp. PhB150]ROS31473.1 membrane protein DedA with SNARE-associated domain [Cellulomonas sp. PhB150]